MLDNTNWQVQAKIFFVALALVVCAAAKAQNKRTTSSLAGYVKPLPFRVPFEQWLDTLEKLPSVSCGAAFDNDTNLVFARCLQPSATRFRNADSVKILVEDISGPVYLYPHSGSIGRHHVYVYTTLYYFSEKHHSVTWLEETWRQMRKALNKNLIEIDFRERSGKNERTLSAQFREGGSMDRIFQMVFYQTDAAPFTYGYAFHVFFSVKH